MRLNRFRNIYTLGDISSKKILKRHQQSDPFEKDPFKVQSYNFRYAERPSFPVPTLQHKINDSNRTNDCQTFFYNYDFPNTNVNIRKSSVLHNDERVFNQTKFQEYRRKKFLQESAPKSYESKILNIYNGNQSFRCSPNLVMKPTYTQMTKPSLNFTNYDNRNTRNDIQIKRPVTLQTQSGLNKTISSSLSDVFVKRKRSLSSGCEININIKSLEDNSLQDNNVNIKIETDSIRRNLNLDFDKNENTLSKQNKNNKLERFDSSETFVINTNLSKYTLKCQESQEIARKKDSDRIKELTSIYSSQTIKKPITKRNIKSNERLPSLIPAGLNNGFTTTSRFDNYHFMKNNLTRSKSLLEKPKSINNKCITNNNITNSPYNNLNSSTKRLQSIKQIPFYESRHSLPATLNRSEFKTNLPLQRNSNAKLPINVNINVYADNLKLLKV